MSLKRLIGCSALALMAASCGPGGSAPGTVEGKLQKATEYVGQYDFEHAYPLFEAARAASAEGSEAWAQAVYGAGVCKQQMMPAGADTKAEARRDFMLLEEKAPASKYTPRAILNLGRMAELKDFTGDTVDMGEARKRYEEVIAKWPKEAIGGEATMRLAGSYVSTYKEEDVKRGVEIMEKWLAENPKDPLTSGMWQYLGDTYFSPLKDYKKSVAAYKEAEKVGWLQPGRQGLVYWRMAILLERELKDSEGAAEYYTKIIKETPTSGKAYESQLALKRLGKPVPEIEIFKSVKSVATGSTQGAQGLKAEARHD